MMFLLNRCKYTLITLALFLVSLQSFAKNSKPSEELGLLSVQAFANQDLVAVTKLFDVESFVDNVAKSFTDNQKDQEDYKHGFLSAGHMDIANKIFFNWFKQDINYKYMGLNDGKPLIRLEILEGGIEYITLFPSRTNPLMFEDFVTSSTKNKMSERIGSVSQLFLQPSKTLVKKLFGLKDIDHDIVEQLKSIGELNRNNQYQEAYKVIKKLPNEIRDHRVVVELTIQVASVVNENAYKKELDNMERLFGDDESAAFTLIDYYFYQQNYSKMQNAIDKMIKHYGEDAALLDLKTVGSFYQNEFDTAEKYALRGIALEPDYEPIYWSLSLVYNAQKDYTKLVKLFKTLEKTFNLEFHSENFADGEYVDFSQSKEFKDWLN